jgi:hypothetical protein
VLDHAGRMVSTREPQATTGPLFILVRGLDSCAWAVRADVPSDIAEELDRLARDEPPISDFRHAPVSGRIPLYSTSWTNHASLAVARKLKLMPYASSWSLLD